MTNNDIKYLFEDMFHREDYWETSRLHSLNFTTDEFDVLHATLYGGMNGWGESKDYCYDLYEILEALESKGIRAYITKFSIDSLDDLFEVEMELRDLKEFYKEKSE